jgi:electron transport complex protein RnfD
MNLITISGSPHIHGDQTVKKIMWGVVFAMLPALLVSIWYFGIGAITTTAVAVVTCIIAEYFMTRYLLHEKPSISDGSAIITGMLLAFNVPSSLPWWQTMLGGIFAIGVAKIAFGGLGKNLFNPALVGRIFLLVSFPVNMTTWPVPLSNRWVLVDALTGPTPLGQLKEGLANGETLATLKVHLPAYQDMFMGQIGGSLGEVSAIAILLGGIYMLYRGIISWHIPIAYLTTVAAFTGILYMIDPTHFIDPVFHLLAGGLMLGAFFMATDMVTSPMTYKGMLVFGVGCGVLTVCIRNWGAYPEGVSFAILIMNAFVPLINKGFKPKRFGEVANG